MENESTDVSQVLDDSYAQQVLNPPVDNTVRDNSQQSAALMNQLGHQRRRVVEMQARALLQKYDALKRQLFQE